MFTCSKTEVTCSIEAVYDINMIVIDQHKYSYFLGDCFKILFSDLKCCSKLKTFNSQHI